MKSETTVVVLLQVQTCSAFESVATGTVIDSLHLFSSTSAVWNQPGAASYAAGNAFLDAYADSCQRAGMPGLACQFGPFSATGMAAAYSDQLKMLGLNSLRPLKVKQTVT